MSPRGALPEPLKLRRHLDCCNAAELEDFLRFWGGQDRSGGGRADLVERLHRIHMRVGPHTFARVR